MDAASSGATNEHVQPKGGNGIGAAKRLLGGEETPLPEPKRAKVGGNPDVASDKESCAPGPSATPEATRKSQKGKQNEKNRGRRRGTRPDADDHPDRPKAPRLPKKQCAILIGFSGTHYAGMQM